MYKLYGCQKKKIHLMKNREHADKRQLLELTTASKYLHLLHHIYGMEFEDDLESE